LKTAPPIGRPTGLPASTQSPDPHTIPILPPGWPPIRATPAPCCARATLAMFAPGAKAEPEAQPQLPQPAKAQRPRRTIALLGGLGAVAAALALALLPRGGWR
jgi:hypothetical protein